MPDFDTRTRQEPVQPSKLKMFVAASKQHISAVASRLRTSARVQLRDKNIIGLLGIGGSILLLAVVAVVTIVWAVLRPADPPAGPPADQLSQKIQTPPTPAYELRDEDSDWTGSPSESTLCDYLYANHYDNYVCLDVTTKVTDPVKLASITQERGAHPTTEYTGGNHISMVEVDFYGGLDYEAGDRDPEATSYCFKSKDLAVFALRGKLHKAELLGKTDDCFVIVYEGSGPALRNTPPQ
jgi:hypothetical protein